MDTTDARLLRPYVWETGIARQFVGIGDVLDLLDYPGYFELLGKPIPAGRDAVLESLESDRLIARDAGGQWNVLNLGAILFAKDVGAFESALSRKAIRFVVYDGDGRAATVTHRMDFSTGYASGFARFNAHVNTLIPSPEDGSAAIRGARPLFPPSPSAN